MAILASFFVTLSGCFASDEEVDDLEAQLRTMDSSVLVDWSHIEGATYSLYLTEIGSDQSPEAGEYTYYGVTPPYDVEGLENFVGYEVVLSAYGPLGETLYEERLMAQPEPPFEPLGKSNDTGVVRCISSDGSWVDCDDADISGQDAEHGRDSESRSGDLEKRGAGNAGFDFTKISRHGATLPDEAMEWSCVRDNVTGLVWEAKSFDIEKLNAYGHLYTWYESDYSVNGGHPGTKGEDRDTKICPFERCDTAYYISLMESEDFCGQSGWRLPERREYLSVIDYGRDYESSEAGQTVKIDVEYFYVSDLPRRYGVFTTGYWTANSVRVDHELTNPEAWVFSERTGYIMPDFKSVPQEIRLVTEWED
ncbi:hypothetical protein J2T60_001773 [Natronospira proteinivora]|uniref:Lcl C-terminal domain-containing protein n=1 Tax=Natronospira proteinivora TaxID=1807133 RepID=A0ABT1GBN0_9GAMM|nr:DUF1566 domain-containing protein [Natronospira proteinivora]MCP1727773.1 hypothetical protein [Natronospira proteinivora]